MDMEEARQLFINEATELLDTMETCLLDVESGAVEIATHIDAIFRAAHTIKGSAGLFGLDSIVAFTHSVESVLDQVRAGRLEFDKDMAELMLDCQEHMNQLIVALSTPETIPSKAQGTELLSRLNRYLKPPPNTTEVVTKEDHEPREPGDWLIRINYGEDVFRDGMDPASQLRYLETIGNIHQVTLSHRFPDSDFDPESCYINLEIEFESNVAKQQLEEVFEFVQENSKVSITAPNKLLEQINAYPEATERIGEVLMNTGALTQRELQLALAEQRLALQENRPSENIGALLVKQGAVDQDLISAALNKQVHQEHKRPPDFQFLKVDARKLDSLIGLIGELVTASAANELLVSQIHNEKLEESFGAMVNLVEQIRDGALSLRMVQIGESFSRLKRIVRDVAKELEKDIQLDIQGAETELDKTMVEKLSDPLMHIVRNAIDHGIESRDLRLYKGKLAKGNLCLKAHHEAGAVVIEIKDDGAGLDVEKIRAKAIEKGLIKSDQLLSREETFKLIFAPGFSTASAVTNLSGRGVGMDVVKRNIEELRGQIAINSEVDVGTSFRIRLPLTLAIIDGFEVAVGDAHLVIPVNMIQECLTFDAEQLAVERDYLNLRGEVLPFVRVRDVLAISGKKSEREHVVVVQFGESKAGLVVDTLLGELQAVIKPLNEMFRAIRGIGGSTILGSGEIGFILDVPQLIDYTRHKESKICTSEVTKSAKVKHE